MSGGSNEKKRKYTSTIMTISTHFKTENACFGESVVSVSVTDEAAGPFIVLNFEQGGKEMRIDFEHLELVFETAKKLINNFKEGE